MCILKSHDLDAELIQQVFRQVVYVNVMFVGCCCWQNFIALFRHLTNQAKPLVVARHNSLPQGIYMSLALAYGFAFVELQWKMY